VKDSASKEPGPASELLGKALDGLSALREDFEQAITTEQWVSNSFADTEAPAFALLVLGNVNGVEVLGREDVAFAVAAAGPARAAWEAAITLAWLLQPEGIPEREKRWAGLLLAERDDWARMQKEFAARDGGSEAARMMAEEVQRIDAMLEVAAEQLKAVGIRQLKRIPDFKGRLESLGKTKQYFMYIHASQLVHPGTRALEHVRSMTVHTSENLRPSYGYRTRAGQWALIIGLAGESVVLSAEWMARRLTSGARVSPDGIAAWQRFTAAVDALGRAR
jgi:hypothetical protein